jgi:hypothetical protein
VRIAADAVLSLQRHVQHVRDDLAPDAVDCLLENGQSLARALHDGHDQPAAACRELLDQRRWDIGAGRRDADPVVRGVLGVPESPVAVNEDNVGVGRTGLDGGCCIKPSRKRCCPLAEVGARDAELARMASRSWRVTNDLAIFGARP